MRRLPLLLLVFLLLTGCAYGDDTTTGGRIVLWHIDEPAESAVLDSLVERFMEINPSIRVSVVAVAEDELLPRYREAAEISLGPDLFIGESRWIPALADAGLIQPLDPYAPVLDQYLSIAVENVRYDGSIYGVPYELSPNALYYNAALTDTPPQTLTEMLNQSSQGLGTAMTSRIDRAMWGLRAFGGRMFDADGRLTLDQGGFASWLTWLDNAQNATGMYLNNDRATLLSLFTTERVAYYVGPPDDRRIIRAAMGERADIRVAALPSGPGGAAGPLLHLDAFLFNHASAQRNTRAALALAQFLTNDENSLRLAREIGYIPANLRVPGIDARTYPIVNSFMTQARTALPINNTEAMSTVLGDGDQLYRQVLDGTLDANVGATQFTSTINADLGFEIVETQQERCNVAGEIRLWHSWDEQDEATLRTIISAFEQACDDTEVLATRFNSERELVTTFDVLYDSNLKPDLLLLSDTWVYTLANQERIQPLDGDSLEQFVPAALNTLRYQNRLYGVPLSLWLTVLFYNQSLVSDPPRTLDDLITEAAEGRGIAFMPTFEQAYWGIPAFGGALFEGQTTLAVNRDNAMVEWLNWLQQAAALPGFLITLDDAQSQAAFTAGESAYYIGSSQRLPELLEAMSQDTIALTGLPAGPAGEASPILRSTALMVNAQVEADRLPLMLAFIEATTHPENQRLIFSEARRFPTNVNVEINLEVTANVTLNSLQTQVTRATTYPNIAEVDLLRALGDEVYRDVLSNELAVEDAVANLIETIDALILAQTAQSGEATPEVTPETTPDDSIP